MMSEIKLRFKNTSCMPDVRDVKDLTRDFMKAITQNFHFGKVDITGIISTKLKKTPDDYKEFEILLETSDNRSGHSVFVQGWEEA